MKKMSLIIALMFIGLGCGEPVESQSQSQTGCSADAECKGDRVCEGGVCVGQNNESQNANNQNNAATPGAFGAECTSDDDCDEALCVFKRGEGSRGFCSSFCDAVAECPSQYDCDEIGGAARKACIPEDRLWLCESTCDEYSDFGCFIDGRKSDCISACGNATVEARKQFDSCFDFQCSDDCLVAMSGDNNPWTEGQGCNRDPMGDQALCGVDLPPFAYDCFPDLEPAPGCVESFQPGIFCCDS